MRFSPYAMSLYSYAYVIFRIFQKKKMGNPSKLFALAAFHRCVKFGIRRYKSSYYLRYSYGTRTERKRPHVYARKKIFTRYSEHVAFIIVHSGNLFGGFVSRCHLFGARKCMCGWGRWCVVIAEGSIPDGVVSFLFWDAYPVLFHRSSWDVGCSSPHVDCSNDTP